MSCRVDATRLSLGTRCSGVVSQGVAIEQFAIQVFGIVVCTQQQLHPALLDAAYKSMPMRVQTLDP